MGERTPALSAAEIQASLSQGERDRVRGVSFDHGRTIQRPWNGVTRRQSDLMIGGSLLLQRIDVIVEARLCRGAIGEMEVDLAARLQRVDTRRWKAQRGRDLLRIGGFVLRLHLAERALENHVRGVVLDLVARALAREGLRPGDLARLEN